MAAKGGNYSQPEDAGTETIHVSSNKSESSIDNTKHSHADGDGALVRTASRSEMSDLPVATKNTSLKEDTSTDPDPGVCEGIVVELSMDVDEVCPCPSSPSLAMNQDPYAVHPWSLLLSAGAKILSTGLYLLDYISNVLVLWQYYILYKNGKFTGVTLDAHYLLFPLIVCLLLMVFDPVVAALAFKLRLPREEHPLRSAFFLPIVQLKRFVKAIIEMGCQCARFEMEESLDLEALFVITSAIKIGPQLVLQFTIICGFGFDEFPKILAVSVIASFLLASYNVGRVVMYQTSKKWSLVLNLRGIIRGLYTFGVLLLQCTAVTSLIFLFGDDFFDTMQTMSITLYFGVGICLLLYLNGFLVVLSKEINLYSWATQAEIMVIAYISATIGPLYPIIENDNRNAKMKSSNSKFALCAHLGIAIGINMLPDILVLLLITLYIPNNYPFCKPVTIPITKQNMYGPNHDNMFYILASCHRFMGYVIARVALSILPCIILPYLTSYEQCDSL